MRRSYRTYHASRTTRRASRTTRPTNPLQTQSHEHRSGINADKTYVQRVGEPMNWITVLLRVREKLCNAHPEIIAQLRLALPFRIGVTQDPLCSCSHSRDACDIFCPRTPLIFVRAAEHEWLNAQTASQK